MAYKKPLYVVNLDKEKNEVIVGEESKIYSKNLKANMINWLVFNSLEKPLECFAKVRYRAKEAKAIVYPYKGYVKVEFAEPQRAITKGQSVVFYDEEGILLGGGKII